ncbi:autophagy-related protein 2 [Rhodotorula toruloides]|uniref:Autophagy-related protein 2 n=1 Tax=Rhodotorula toruloides TaxID=5286 RepID=A0A511KNB2_RHOTO|nr:autophagy-related protein 2 [Rhodotorula toruloides]
MPWTLSSLLSAPLKAAASYLPSVPLPANLQQRLVAFLLRRAIGGFVKGGWSGLGDEGRIEADVREGRFVVRDVEVDEQAVNSLLSPPPLPTSDGEGVLNSPLRFESGSIGTVTALVVWPMTKLDLVIDQVDLVFRVSNSPRPADSPSAPPPHEVPPTPRQDKNDPLAESHSSVSIAHDFISHELLPSEDAELRASLHLSHSLVSSVDLPGAFGGSPKGAETEREAEKIETTVLAGLIERVLARLGVRVKQVRVRLLWGTEGMTGENELELRIDEVEYMGDASEPGAAKVSPIRSLHVSPPRVYLRLAEPPLPHSSAPSRPAADRRYSSESDSSSSSSGDEADLLAMSQSIADLRTSVYSTRSGGSSIAGRSDLFASARSAPFQSVSEEPEEDGPFHDPDAETRAASSNSSPPEQRDSPQLVVALGVSDKPVTLIISTALPSEGDKPISRRPVVTLSADIDTPWTCAVTTEQLVALLSLFARLSPPSTPTSTSAATQPQVSNTFPDVSFSLRAFHLLVALPSKASVQPSPFPPAIFAHPDAVIRAPHLRLRLDGFGLTSDALTGMRLQVDHVALTETSAPAGGRVDNEVWRTLPLLVDDSALSNKSSTDGAANSPDWVRYATTGEGGTAAGQGAVYGRDWRFLPRSAGKKTASKGEDDMVKSPALVLSASSGDGLVVDLAPLHAFIDLSAMGRLLPVVELCADALPPSPGSAASEDAPIAPTPRPSSPACPATAPPRDILEDFVDASVTPRDAVPVPAALTLLVRCPLLRVEFRCPAPKDYRIAAEDSELVRSGRLGIDLVSTRLAIGKLMTELDLDALEAFFATKSDIQAVPFLRISPLVPRTEDPAAVGPRISATLGAAYPAFDTTLPLIRIKLDKPAFDGLQLFADDVSQYLVVELGESSVGSSNEGHHGMRGTRMIGSRYFGVKSFMHPRRRRRESETDSTTSTATVRGRSEEGGLGDRAETRTASVQVNVTDVIVDLHLGSLTNGSTNVRHLTLAASDLSIVVEVLNNANADFRAKLIVMDVKMEHQSKITAPVTILSRTMPRDLTTPSSPLVHVGFTSSTERETSLKESKVQLTLSDLTYYVSADLTWLQELERFVKAPEGAFEHVVPNELSRLRVRLNSVCAHVSVPSSSSHLVFVVGEARLRTDLMPDLPRTTFLVDVIGLRALAIDSEADLVETAPNLRQQEVWRFWKAKGFAPIAHVEQASVEARQGNGLVLPDFDVLVDGAKVDIALCADTVAGLATFANDFAAALSSTSLHSSPRTTAALHRRPGTRKDSGDLLASVDPAAFEKASPLDDLPEMLDDDVPTNTTYITDALRRPSSRPVAMGAGQRTTSSASLPAFGHAESAHLLSEIDGETIKTLVPGGLQIIDEWLCESRVEDDELSASASSIRCRVVNSDVSLRLHGGYDWATTRKAIEEEAKAVRRRLKKIRQLLANGQAADASAETASVLMFGSVQLGLPPGASELPAKELLAAINEELDDSLDSGAVSTAATSWQSLPGGVTPPIAKPPGPAVVGKLRKRLTRSKAFAIEINLRELNANFDSYSASLSLEASKLLGVDPALTSRISADVGVFEIIDNIKTSTWRKFLTELRPSEGGVMRPTGGRMARLELRAVKPVSMLPNAHDELVAKLRVSPLRLYIDQDALDFLKTFGAFERAVADAPAQAGRTAQEPFYQRVEILPVKLKVDYKPKRVDYNALRRGKTAELMNFFHFDGSEMTLRHLVVTGVSGTSTLSALVQDIWTPDVKAHQLADVVGGIAPIRSVVNVGAGMANLVLLPMEQYRKDGRVVRGLQKGAQAFAKQTTLEAINIGAKLATGTQVILEQAEHVLGAKFSQPVSAEAIAPFAPDVPHDPQDRLEDSLVGDGMPDLRSRYAEQPADFREGVQIAYKTLGDNVKEAAQTILAVPMEVYERSGNEGAVRAVVRAIPIAVLKPMIGASGAVSKALLGLRNTLDSNSQQSELEDKYK